MQYSVLASILFTFSFVSLSLTSEPGRTKTLFKSRKSFDFFDWFKPTETHVATLSPDDIKVDSINVFKMRLGPYTMTKRDDSDSLIIKDSIKKKKGNKAESLKDNIDRLLVRFKKFKETKGLLEKTIKEDYDGKGLIHVDKFLEQIGRTCGGLAVTSEQLELCYKFMEVIVIAADYRKNDNFKHLSALEAAIKEVFYSFSSNQEKPFFTDFNDLRRKYEKLQGWDELQKNNYRGETVYVPGVYYKSLDLINKVYDGKELKEFEKETDKQLARTIVSFLPSKEQANLETLLRTRCEKSSKESKKTLKGLYEAIFGKKLDTNVD